jgi:hypothetical protein
MEAKISGNRDNTTATAARGKRFAPTSERLEAPAPAIPEPESKKRGSLRAFS